ncbi:hypothetical protein R1sor_000029 [Riccia sorocarpa]|uniref:Uncharacterized protein n=1 Tax=Riccia sorocarpa TaxID=122646 RepID=A0ABD3GRX3_9MARC
MDSQGNLGSLSSSAFQHLRYGNVHLHGGIPSPGLYHSPASDDFEDSQQADDFQEFHGGEGAREEPVANSQAPASNEVPATGGNVTTQATTGDLSTAERKSSELPTVFEEDWYELIDSFMATRPCVTTPSSADSSVQEGVDDLSESDVPSDRDNVSSQ